MKILQQKMPEWNFFFTEVKDLESDFHLFQRNPFKNDEKYFLFHLKAFFVLKIFKFLS